MKEATVLLHLSKDHQVLKNQVTPIEAMILVAEHQKNVGGTPIKIEDVTNVQEIVIEVETEDPKTKAKVKSKGTRSEDSELDRLRVRYTEKKVNHITSTVRQLPTTFEEAIKIGLTKQPASGGMVSETRI